MGKCYSSKYSQTHENTVISSFQNEIELNFSIKLNKIPINTGLLITKTYGNPLEKYDIKKKIGRSSKGKLYQISHKEMEILRAMKKKKNPKENDFIVGDEEIDILRKLDHPNIIKIFEYYTRKEHLYLILEYLPNGDLNSKLLKNEIFDEAHVSNIFQQLISAVCYFHQKGVNHNFLKPDKIFLGEKDRNGHYMIKVVDFGLNDENEKSNYPLIVQNNYTPPELLNNKSEVSGERIDMWSCGVILFHLLYGKLPFSGSENEIIDKKKNQRIEFDPNVSVPPDAKELISKLLDRDPTKRLSASEAIKHNWITSHALKLDNPKHNENLLTNLVKRWKMYKPGNIIQKTTLAYIIHNIPNEELREIERLFRLIDEDDDGKISRKNLLYKFSLIEKEKDKASFAAFSKEIDSIFDCADYDSSGYIENQEFIRACVDRTKLFTDENLKFAYDYFDPNCLGFIGINELAVIFPMAERMDLEKFMDEITKKYYNDVKLQRKINLVAFKKMIKEF